MYISWNLNKTPILFLLFILLSSEIFSQVTGMWKTIGDVDGKEKSIIHIYEENGKLHGKVVEVLPASKYTICERCPGDLKGKPIKGMVVLRDLTKTPNGGIDGKVIDPGSGKTYDCYLELEGENKIKLRGYIGLHAIGRTQYWYRVM